MSKNALLCVALSLAVVAGPAWAKEGTVVQNPDGSWGCIDKNGNPIPPGANGRWEGKLVVGTPCRPATLIIAGNIGEGGGASGGASGVTGPTRAANAQAASIAPTKVRDLGQVSAVDAAPAAASFDAKGRLDLVVEPAGKSISEKGVSSTKSR